MSVLVDNKIVADSVNYSDYVSEHGIYQHQRINQNTGGLVNSCSAGGGNTSIFELPVNIYNYGRSHLEFTAQCVGAGGRSARAFVDGVPHIQRIRLYNSGQKELVRIDDFNKYSNMLFRRETSLEKALTYDRVIASPDDPSASNIAGYASGLIPSNLSLTGVEVEEAGDAGRYESVQQIAYLEPKCYVQSIALGGSTFLNWRIPLSQFMNTLLAMDRDMYLGSEVLYLEITWSAAAKVFMTGTDDKDPTVGAAAGATDVLLSNIGLWVAIQKDEKKRMEVMNIFKSGRVITIPFVYSYKQNLPAGTSHTVSVKYSRGNGSYLKALYWTAYNNAETGLTTYDKNNRSDIDPPENVKIKDFYVEVNGLRTNPNNYNTAKGQDWLVAQRSLKGSCIMTSEQYYYHHTHKLDFCDRTSLDLPPIAPFDNLMDGVSLSSEVKVDIYATTGGGLPLNHYIYAVTTKALSLNELGVVDNLI